ncbi:hypothetical protein [Clostridium sp.]|nr:hypothetical protein [Clostridium sp.]MBS5308843.1 hypothetical protein [Clostridium sp.]
MKDYKFEFLDYLTEKYDLNKGEIKELKNIMIKNDVSEERLLYLLKRKIN